MTLCGDNMIGFRSAVIASRRKQKVINRSIENRKIAISVVVHLMRIQFADVYVDFEIVLMFKINLIMRSQNLNLSRSQNWVYFKIDNWDSTGNLRANRIVTGKYTGDCKKNLEGFLPIFLSKPTDFQRFRTFYYF